MTTDRKPTCIACAGAGGGISEEEVKALIDTSEEELLDLGWEKVTVTNKRFKATIDSLIDDDYEILFKTIDNEPPLVALFSRENYRKADSGNSYAPLLVMIGDRIPMTVQIGNSSIAVKTINTYIRPNQLANSCKLYDFNGNEITSANINDYIDTNDSMNCLKPFILQINHYVSYGNINIHPTCIIAPGSIPNNILMPCVEDMSNTLGTYVEIGHIQLTWLSVYNHVVNSTDVKYIFYNMQESYYSLNNPYVYKRKRLIPYKVITQ